MTTNLRPAPDWFDRLWQSPEVRKSIPSFFYTDSTKRLARELVNRGMSEAAKVATTPEGIQAIIAFGKIATIMKGVRGVCESENPNPAEVAEGVERLVQKVVGR